MLRETTIDPVAHPPTVAGFDPGTPSAAKLLRALHSGFGHAVVTAADPGGAEALFESIEPELIGYCLVHLRGDALDPNKIGTRLHGLVGQVSPAPRIAVVVANAEGAPPATLEALLHAVEATASVGSSVRIVLLGGPSLSETLRSPQVRALASRIVTRVGVEDRAPRSAIFPTVAGGVAIAALLALALWDGGWSSYVPTRSQPESPPVATVAPIPSVPLAPAAPPAAVDVATLPPAPTSPTPRVTPLAGGPALQVGAFRNAANAEALRERVSAEFPTVYIAQRTNRDGILHRVRIPYRTEAERAALARRLKAAGHAALAARD